MKHFLILLKTVEAFGSTKQLVLFSSLNIVSFFFSSFFYTASCTVYDKDSERATAIKNAEVSNHSEAFLLVLKHRRDTQPSRARLISQ